MVSKAIDLGVELVDAPQIGTASCGNIAKVLAHLLANGHVLGAPETITTFEETAVAAAAGAAEAEAAGGAEGAGGEEDEEEKGEAPKAEISIPTFDDSYDAIAGSPVSSRLVRVQGVPFEATQAQIANFFSGLNIKPNGIWVGILPSGQCQLCPSTPYLLRFCCSSTTMEHLHHCGLEVFACCRSIYSC